MTAVAHMAPWADHSGTTVKLFVKTGSSLQWFDSGAVPVDANGVRLRLDLASVAHAEDVREIGVMFTPRPGAKGDSAVYVDNIRLR